MAPNLQSTTCDPLSVGMAVAERFMRIDPPPKTYMYDIGLWGLVDLYQAAGEQRLIEFVLNRHKPNRDHLVYLDWSVYEATGDKKWIVSMRKVGDAWLANSRRDREGALLDPRGRYTIDVSSGLATYPIIFGHVLQDERFFDDAYNHITIVRGYLEDPETGLWYNRWGHGLHPHRPNPGLWGRGNGWLINAWGRVAHLWEKTHHRYAEMMGIWERYCRANAAFQTPSGLWRQLMVRPWSFEDATATGLIGAGIGYGVLYGSLPAEMGAVAYRAALGACEIVDEAGNIHNVSMTAGGYNYEQQYESCATFNEAHGDGSVMGLCAAAAMLLKKQIIFDRTPPAVKPVIVTEPEPDSVTFNQLGYRQPREVAAPVLQRTLALERLPELDKQGSVILGLLHWAEFSQDKTTPERARQLYEVGADRLEQVARWRIAAQLAGNVPMAVLSSLDEYLAAAPRDREGLILDEFGGYDICRLYNLLPLLGMAGAATGKDAYIDNACRQLLGYQEWLEEPISGLWHSAYGRGHHPRRVTPGFWTLGLGYLLAGIVDLLDYLPRSHERYVDVICLLRGLMKPLHEWLPVYGGWRQLINDYHSFSCVAANGLLTYGTAKAVLQGWVKSANMAIPWGGMYHLSVLVKEDGSYGPASLPTGGLDTLEEYELHRVENDPYALGPILSGCARVAMCDATGINYGYEDMRLGAR